MTKLIDRFDLYFAAALIAHTQAEAGRSIIADVDALVVKASSTAIEMERERAKQESSLLCERSQ